MDRETRKYWATQRRQMLRRDRQQRGNAYGSALVTKILLGLMVLSFLIELFRPNVITLIGEQPGGVAYTLLLSSLSPGGLIGLLFAGVFLWIIGSQIEGLMPWWQYLVLFFGSGIIGGLVSHIAGAGPIGGTFASFGLAGAYVMAMTNRRVAGAAQWAVLLLAINVVFSGFQVGLLAGMLAAFFAGLLIARALHV